MLYLIDKETKEKKYQIGKEDYTEDILDRLKVEKVDKKPPEVNGQDKLFFKKGKWIVEKGSEKEKIAYLKKEATGLYQLLQSVFKKNIAKLKKIAIEKPYMDTETADVQYQTYEEMYKQALLTPDDALSKVIIKKNEERKAYVHPYILQVNNERSVIEKMLENITNENQGEIEKKIADFRTILDELDAD